MTYHLNHLAGPASSSANPSPDSLYNRNLDRATELIRRADPDFIGFQDVDFHAARSAYVHQLDSLATRLGYAAGAQAVNWNDRYVPSTFVHPAVHSGPLVSGQGILSQYPLRQHVRKELSHSQSFGRNAFRPNSLVQVTPADIGGWPLLIMNVHLSATDPDVREAQARTVSQFYVRLAEKGYPIVMIGSFNSLMPSAQASGGATTDETMETLLQGTNLQTTLSSESAQLTGQSVATYPAENPTQKIDYVFYRPRLVVPIDSEIRCGDPSPPSSHCALTVSFVLPRPEDKLPDTRIPDEQLPSLDSILQR